MPVGECHWPGMQASMHAYTHVRVHMHMHVSYMPLHTRTDGRTTQKHNAYSPIY